jgi:integrase
MTQPRKRIAKLGRRGSTVLVVETTNHGAACYAVEYRLHGKARREFYPRTRAGRREALAYADGVLASRQSEPARRRLTLEQLFQAFAAEEYPAIRYNTQRLYRENWRQFETFVGSHVPADDVGMDSCRELRQELERRGLKVNTIAKVFHTVRRVYRWGEEHELIERATPLRYRYKVAKDARPASPAEYRTEEFTALLAALPLDRATTWRAHVVLALCGYQGVRQHAALHLQWADVDWTRDVLIWRAEWDKVGKEWEQPMRAPTRAMLEAVRAKQVPGPWVLPKGSAKGKGETYTIQSFWAALRRAETAAKVERLPGRAGHGLRRMVAGNVTEATNNPVLGLHAIGDTDLKQATRYIKHRQDQIKGAFDQLDDSEGNSCGSV